MILRKQASNDHLHLIVHLQLDNKYFWWRCAWGSHPFPSRTRWLRPRRPMVLCWRRHGRAGGCQIIWGCSSVGRAPALQAGGQEFESLHLHSARNIKLCNWPEPKAFDINVDWYRSFEETSNGFALRRLCTLKTSYRDKY